MTKGTSVNKTSITPLSNAWNQSSAEKLQAKP
jgi:hypothetical protein